MELAILPEENDAAISQTDTRTSTVRPTIREDGARNDRGMHSTRAPRLRWHRMKNYDRLPQDIRRRFEAVVAHGAVHDRHAKAFRDAEIERFAQLLLHKYRVVEVDKHLGDRS